MQPGDIKYKVTNSQWQTRNNTQWGPGCMHQTDGYGYMCGPGWLHFFHDPRIAAMVWPAYLKRPMTPILWTCKVEGFLQSNGYLKGACTKMTTIEQISMPDISNKQRLDFCVRCLSYINPYSTIKKLCSEWLSGEFEHVPYNEFGHHIGTQKLYDAMRYYTCNIDNTLIPFVLADWIGNNMDTTDKALREALQETFES